MKKYILSFLSISAVGMLLTSASNGPANQNMNATGGPGATTSCGNCHGGGSGTTTGTVTLRKASAGSSSPGVTVYQPDSHYVVTVSGNHAAMSHFGFQLMALNSSNNNAGSFMAFPSNVHQSTVSGKTIVEHGARIPKTGSQFEVSFDWHAPAAGTGTVTFYGVLNAVNNDGSTGGDKPSAPFSVPLMEDIPTGINDAPSAEMATAYPNPARGGVTINLKNHTSGMYEVTVTDLQGKKIYTGYKAVYGADATLELDASGWAKGAYQVMLSNGARQSAVRVVKD